MASPFADAAYTDKPGETRSEGSVLNQIKGKVEPQASSQHNATVGAPLAQDFAQTQPYGWSGYFQSLGVIFLLLALIALAFYLLKRFGPRSGIGLFKRGELKLEAQLPLGPRKSVVVVRFLNKRLVLGVADAQINLLTEVDDEHASSDDFSQTMERAQRLDTPRS